MENLTQLTSKLVSDNKYYQEWKAATEADILAIPTDILAVGSNVLVSDAAATFKQWNGTAWITVT